MSKTIWLDMDGTVYDLYHKENWLNDLEEEKPNVFSDDTLLMFDKDVLETVCTNLIAKGYKIGICSWTPMQASPEYCEICRKEKINWLERNMPYVSEINISTYGTPKQKMIQQRAKVMILIDDNAEVCKMWNTTIQRISYNVSKEFTAFDVLNYLNEMN